jgi:HPt (histidine-containing phosphotransfer) domain-containing protein
MADQDRVSAVQPNNNNRQLPDPKERNCPIDLVFLAHQTLGDEQLEIELLMLFDRQAGDVLTALGEARNQETQRDLAHRLKGSARAIGAAAVAAAAEQYESAAQTNAVLPSYLTALAAAVAEARSAIRQLMPMVAA